MAEIFENVQCHVKWYSPKKCFGFFVLPDEDGDIFVHRQCLEDSGISSKAMSDGVKADIDYEVGDDGRKRCVAIRRLHSTGAKSPKSKNKASRKKPRPTLKVGDRVVVEIKVYYHDKGFGFAVPLEGGSDLFFHINDVEERLQKFLKPGQRFEVAIGENERGLLAVPQERHQEAVAAE